jgi:hypothetical protein
MTRRFCLLLALAAAPFASGCLLKTTTHRLYLSPQGALTWSVLEQDVRSTETGPLDRAAEEDAFLDGVRSATHPTLEALRRLAPSDTWLRLLRADRPYTVLTEAHFERVDVVIEQLLNELHIPGTASLQRAGDEWSLGISIDLTAMDADDQPSQIAALIEELDCYRLVLTEGRFTAAIGFAIVDDGAAVALKPEQVPTDRPAQLRLSWKERSGRSGSGLLSEHLAEHGDGLLHFVHRAEGEAAMGLLERREVARDQDALLAAGLAELLHRTADVDEHEVGLRVGRLHAALAEPLHGEVAGGGVARALGGDE